MKRMRYMTVRYSNSQLEDEPGPVDQIWILDIRNLGSTADTGNPLRWQPLLPSSDNPAVC